LPQELAGIRVPPTCADQAAADKDAACVEGSSLGALVKPAKEESVGALQKHDGNRKVVPGVVTRVKQAAFWQWSKMMIEKKPVMGYAMATDNLGDGCEYRYEDLQDRVPADRSTVHNMGPTAPGTCFHRQV
jgi:hypothetical protein